MTNIQSSLEALPTLACGITDLMSRRRKRITIDLTFRPALLEAMNRQLILSPGTTVTHHVVCALKDYFRERGLVKGNGK